MGTRSLTHVLNDDGKTLVTIYRQFDGYLDGQGAEIKRILGKRKLGNGIGHGCTYDNFSNGMPEAAAQLVAELKDRQGGNVYIYPPDSEDCWEDYTYTVAAHDGEFTLKACEESRVVYDGPLAAFDPKKIIERGCLFSGRFRMDEA